MFRPRFRSKSRPQGSARGAPGPGASGESRRRWASPRSSNPSSYPVTREERRVFRGCKEVFVPSPVEGAEEVSVKVLLQELREQACSTKDGALPWEPCVCGAAAGERWPLPRTHWPSGPLGRPRASVHFRCRVQLIVFPRCTGSLSLTTEGSLVVKIFLHPVFRRCSHTATRSPVFDTSLDLRPGKRMSCSTGAVFLSYTSLNVHDTAP